MCERVKTGRYEGCTPLLRDGGLSGLDSAMKAWTGPVSESRSTSWTRGVATERAPEVVWRRILVEASTKCVLGNLVRLVHDNPDNQGIAPTLARRCCDN